MLDTYRKSTDLNNTAPGNNHVVLNGEAFFLLNPTQLLYETNSHTRFLRTLARNRFEESGKLPRRLGVALRFAARLGWNVFERQCFLLYYRTSATQNKC